MRNDTALDIRWPAKFNEIPKEVFHRADVYRLELQRIFAGRNGIRWPMSRKFPSPAI
ncbi:MAG TPA: hypothetical protein VIJ42_16750 [Stellaceae bacterium]